MEKELTQPFEQLLREQRKNYLVEFRKAEAALDSIAEERESEVEEHAQEEETAGLLARLDDRTLYALREIDAALQRILDGTYGLCEGGCAKAIPAARLRTMPAARFCRQCAAQQQASAVVSAEAPEIVSPAPLPGDLNLLNEHELVETIWEQLKQNRRLDLEELRVVCRKGVVYLSGALPSESEHDIVLQIITDVLGLKEIVDHIQVEELTWERESSLEQNGLEVMPAAQERSGTDELVESDEEGEEPSAPVGPLPRQH
jgi:RNA polymerase-binding transcription factor DksA